MDFLTIILEAIGWSRDSAARKGDQRTEAFRLNAEVAGDCMRTITLITFAGASLSRRLEALYPGQPEAYKAVTEHLATMRSQAEQIYAMAEDYKRRTTEARGWIDWGQLLRKLHEWRATISAVYPYTEGVIKHYEELISQEEARRGSSPLPPRVAFKDRDRGWDAPPL